MESYLKREEFNTTVTNNVWEFFNKHGKNIGALQKREFTAKIDNFFGHSPQLSKLATEIGLVSKLNVESVEMLIRATLEFSYNNYKVDMLRKFLLFVVS
jgi:HD-GYP domain-containing protein (c-di-GMP phosphodiesterase class II)